MFGFCGGLRYFTPYPDVVEFVRELVSAPGLARRTTLVVDATGVGAPVVDLLRRASLPCSVVPVMITGGDAESGNGDVWRAPKRDLIVGLQVAMQKRWLEVAKGDALVSEFVKELLALRMRVSVTGGERYGGRGHDDLVSGGAGVVVGAAVLARRWGAWRWAAGVR